MYKVQDYVILYLVLQKLNFDTWHCLGIFYIWCNSIFQFTIGTFESNAK